MGNIKLEVTLGGATCWLSGVEVNRVGLVINKFALWFNPYFSSFQSFFRPALCPSTSLRVRPRSGCGCAKRWQSGVEVNRVGGVRHFGRSAGVRVDGVFA